MGSGSSSAHAPLGWIHLMRPEVSPTRQTESEVPTCGRLRRGRPRVILWLLTQASRSGTLAFALAAPVPLLAPLDWPLLPLFLQQPID